MLNPGPGVGGHCIAVDPYFLMEKAREQAGIIACARQINTSMSQRVAEEADRVLCGLQGKKIAILGIAYKGDVGDSRESPALPITKGSQEEGAAWKAHDSHVVDSLVPLSPPQVVLDGADLVTAVTDHMVFADLDPWILGKTWPL